MIFKRFFNQIKDSLIGPNRFKLLFRGNVLLKIKGCEPLANITMRKLKSILNKKVYTADRSIDSFVMISLMIIELKYL